MQTQKRDRLGQSGGAYARPCRAVGGSTSDQSWRRCANLRVSSAALTTTGGIAAALYAPSTAGQTTELDIPLLAVGPVQGPWEIANDDNLIANGG